MSSRSIHHVTLITAFATGFVLQIMIIYFLLILAKLPYHVFILTNLAAFFVLSLGFKALAAGSLKYKVRVIACVNFAGWIPFAGYFYYLIVP